MNLSSKDEREGWKRSEREGNKSKRKKWGREGEKNGTNCLEFNLFDGTILAMLTF